MNPLDSFTFLTLNIPIWIEKLDQLAMQAADRHSEFLRLSQTPSLISARKKKTGSTESLRPNDTIDLDNVHSTAPVIPSSPLRVQVDPDNKQLFREVREARRRRRPASLLSNASGPPKFRTRMSLIVYYDSAIQEGFEILVRNINIARNNLRKGKVSGGFKFRSSRLDRGTRQGTAGGDCTTPSPTSTRSWQSNDGVSHAQGKNPTVLDELDKELEAAQSLCELGAHQFLREGNCSEEVEGTKEIFDNCVKIAEQQVMLLRSEDQREQELQEQAIRERNLQKDREQEQQEKEEMNTASVYSSATGTTDTPSIGLEEKQSLPMALPAIGMIEVDDDSDASSVHIDISAFRSARRVYKAK